LVINDRSAPYARAKENGQHVGTSDCRTQLMLAINSHLKIIAQDWLQADGVVYDFADRVAFKRPKIGCSLYCALRIIKRTSEDDAHGDKMESFGFRRLL